MREIGGTAPAYLPFMGLLGNATADIDPFKQ
jgi:hypothetical protein